MATIELTPEQLEQVGAALREEYKAAETLANDQGVEADRKSNIDHYLGRIPELPQPGIGRSKVVSQDVSDVIDGLMPGLLEIMLGETPVSFVPLGPDDDKVAEQETAACSHVLFTLNPGFLVVHDAVKAGLMEKNAYIKVMTKRRRRVDVETLANQTDESLAMVGEVGETLQKTPTGFDPSGQQLYDVRIEREVKYDEVVVDCPPTEDIKVSTACKGDIRAATYIAHDLRMTAAELIELGVSQEKVDALDGAPPDDDNRPEKLARRGATASSSTAHVANKVNKLIAITEHYIQTDLDGDGRPEKLIVHTAKDKTDVLMAQSVEDHDFASWSPIRLPHRHQGIAVADKTRPYMQVKTSLMRSLMDGLYHSVNPRPVIGDDISNEHTLDDYLLVRPGAPIRTAKTVPIPTLQMMPVIQHVGPVVELMDSKQEYSTGFSRAGVAVDKNSFNETATGANILNTAQQAVQKLYARMFVEQAMTRVFELVHRHLRTANIQALPIQVEDQWVEVSPREWKERKHIRVNVNLGPSTEQDDKAAALGAVQLTAQVIQLQKGDQGPYVYPSHVHAVLRNFYEVHGKKNFSRFVADPTQPVDPQKFGVREQPPQPPMNPEVQAAMIQAEAFKQVETLKAELKAQTTMQVETLKAQVDIMIERFKGMLDQHNEQQRMQLDHQAKLHANATRPQPNAFPGMGETK